MVYEKKRSPTKPKSQSENKLLITNWRVEPRNKKKKETQINNLDSKEQLLCHSPRVERTLGL